MYYQSALCVMQVKPSLVMDIGQKHEYIVIKLLSYCCVAFVIFVSSLLLRLSDLCRLIVFCATGYILDGHARSAVKVLIAIQYSVAAARNGYIRNAVV